MVSNLYSDNWYRVEPLHLRLRTHVQVQRRVYRDRVWYVLRDAASGRHHRVSEAAYHIVGRLTGRLSVQQIWDAARDQIGDGSPTQDEVITLLSTLHDAHLIQSDMAPDVEELFQQRDRSARKKRIAAANPLYVRVPLVDPAAFLDRWVSTVRPLFTAAGMLIWILILGLSVIALIPHWEELMTHGARLLETRHLLLMLLCYPAIKVLHELGHAFAVRVWGGEVREMGIALMLLMPVPYVDASASSSFKERHRRVIVGAAGIMVELALAAIAAWLWLSTAPGLWHDIAFTVMAIGGLSTVLFNGNPLMRLDGYHVLSDALEIPNLAARSNASCLSLIQRYLLGIRSASVPGNDRFERAFLPVFCLLSTAYRLFISVAITLWIASKSLALAVVAAGILAIAQLAVPAYRALAYLLRSPTLSRHRPRAVALTLTTVLGAALMLAVVPVPVASRALGILWFPEDAQIRAQASGFVTAVYAGETVREGEAVVELSNALIETQLEIGSARVRLAQVSLRQAMRDQPSELARASQELATAEAEFNEAGRKKAALRITANTQGQLVLPHAMDLPGRYIKQGMTLGHVVSTTDPVIRVAVSQEQAGRIREGVAGVEIRLAERIGATHQARVLREIPAAGNQLQSAALGDRAGGMLRTDPTDAEGLRTTEPVFFFDLSVPDLRRERIGGRAYVRFDHGVEPLARQWLRLARQTFLRRVETRGS